MRLLKLRPFCGPKRFVFKDPDTGYAYQEATEKDLIKRILGYRAQNQLQPINHLHAVLQNYWCALPENQGECEECPKLQRGLLAYIRGGVALIDNLWYGPSARVNQETADARSEICVNCPYNIFPDKGPFIAWSDMMAENSIGDSRSARHNDLGNCEVCSCTLRAKVFYKGDMGLTEDQKEKMREVGCWQVLGGENHGRKN